MAVVGRTCVLLLVPSAGAPAPVTSALGSKQASEDRCTQGEMFMDEVNLLVFIEVMPGKRNEQIEA